MIYSIFDKDGNTVNTIVASEEFAKSYCEKHGYTYEQEPDPVEPEADPEPTLDERVQTLEDASAEMSEALDLLLSGVTE